MNFRVVTDGVSFYPQRRGFFGWRFYYELGTPQIDGLELGPEIVRFASQNEAKQFFTPTPWSVCWTSENHNH